MSNLPPQPRLQDLAISDPVDITTDPASPSYPMNPAGAYQYVIRVLLNCSPTMQPNVYNVLEQNGLKDDILCVEGIPEDCVQALTFLDLNSGQLQNILASDLAKLLLWKAFIHYQAIDGCPLKQATDVLQINPNEFNAWTKHHTNVHGTLYLQMTVFDGETNNQVSPVKLRCAANLPLCNKHFSLAEQSNNVKSHVTPNHDNNGVELQPNVQFTRPTLQQAAAYPVNHTGAYHYVVQVLLNNFASSQQSLYAVLENNGFESDILGIMFISVNELAYLQFINHETGKVQLINQADLAKLYVWIAYCNHCAKAGHRLCTPEDILAINASSFKNFCEDYISQHGDFGDLWNVPRACFTFDASAASQYVWEILMQQCPKRNRRFYTVLEQTGLLDDVWTIQDMSENQLRALMFLDPETNVKRQITMADFVTLRTWKQYTTKCFQDGYPITNVQDVLSIDPSEFDTWHFNLEDDECKHERSYIPPISYKIPDCYNCKPFEDSLTNCIDYSSTTQSVHEPSTALQSTSNEPLPGNGENNDNNLPVKTHATANNVSITESSLGTGENIISVPVPTPVNEKEIYKKAYDHSYNVSITSVHSAQSIGTIGCASGELYDEELLDASVPLDWNIDLDYQVLDWSFDLWGETTIPSSSLLMSDQALPSDSNEEPSDSNEELVTFYDAEDPMFVNLLPDIDGTTAVIPDTSMIILGTSEADHNSSVSVGIKVITAPTEPCGMCN